MIATLEEWDNRCVSVLSEIEGQVRDIRNKATERKRREKEHEMIFEKASSEEGGRLMGKAGGKRGAGAEADGDANGLELGEAMDIDDTSGRGGERNAKRVGRFASLGKRLGR